MPSPGSRVRAQSSTDSFKAVFSVTSLSANAQGALGRFSQAFGYPVEILSKDSVEVSALREQGLVSADDGASYGLLPADVLDVALLHDEWASFQDSSTCSFIVFSLKRSSGRWQPQGVLARSEPHDR